MNNKLAYYKPVILFIGITLTTFGMLIFGYFMGVDGERKAMEIVFPILVWYIGVVFLCEASSYRLKGADRK